MIKASLLSDGYNKFDEVLPSDLVDKDDPVERESPYFRVRIRGANSLLQAEPETVLAWYDWETDQFKRNGDVLDVTEWKAL